MTWEDLSPPYRTIVADPPWDHSDGFSGCSRTPGKWTGPVVRKPLPYSTLSLEEIAALPVRDLGRDCRMFLWVTNRYLPDGLSILNQWGYRYRQTLVWHKRDANVGGSVAPNAEFILVAQRGQPGRKAKASDAVLTTSAPKTHSRKPAAFYDLVEHVSPGPYVELFCRQPRFGWDSWGWGFED